MAEVGGTAEPYPPWSRNGGARTARLGVLTITAIAGFLLVASLVSGAQLGISRGAQAVIAGSAMAAGLALLRLGEARLEASPRMDSIVGLYSATVLTALLAAIALSDPAYQELVWAGTPIVVFNAVTLRFRQHVGLTLYLGAGYLVALAIAAGPWSWFDVFLRLGVIGVVALFGACTARRDHRTVSELTLARDEARRRAESLAAIHRASRSLSSVDPQQILDAVTAAVRELGHDTVAVYVHDREQDVLRYASLIGEPDDTIAGREFPVDAGVAGMTLAQGGTVVVEDYRNHPLASTHHVTMGIESAIGTPVMVDAEIAGMLVAGSFTARTYSDGAVEGFELLAAQAGRALEIAGRYEREAETVEELRALDRLKSDFISTVSHELRTPLTVIVGMSGTLTRTWPTLTDGERLRLVEAIDNNARSLTDVITTLLDFARLERGTLDVLPEPLDLGELMDEVCERLAPMLADHRMIADHDGPLTVMADRRLLVRVIENLLVNATRHTPDGTTITLSARRSGNTVTAAVDDDGPGIPADELLRLGERFFRGGDSTTRSTRGVGLGLALVTEILKLHHSDLMITSELGRGARFSFELAAADADVSAPDPRTSAPVR